MPSLQAYFAVHPAVFMGVALVFGLVIGSFLNVVILRLPVMLDRRWQAQANEILHPKKKARALPPFDLTRPGSHCPHCGHAIGPWENVPVLSFLLLRGKCVECKKKISWRYPIVELVSGIMAAIVAWRFGYSVAGGAALLLTWALIALAFIDYDTQLLPDDITLPLLWVGLLFNISGTFAPLSAGVIGAMAGYGVLWLVYHAFKLITGKEGMGFGDFKLFGALGAWLGWQQLPLILLLSSFAGALIGICFILIAGRDRKLPIPFGPFLAGSGWVAMMWGDQIVQRYLQLVRF